MTFRPRLQLPVFLFLSLFFLSGWFAVASGFAESAAAVLSDTSEDFARPQDIFFSATRTKRPLRHVTDNVTVITREELDKWPVDDLDEALGLVNGIVIQDTGFMGQVATAQIHGSKANEVRVMIDDIPMNPTTSGGIADLSQIPLEIVDRIEIVKGPSSSVWGSAMGGVINIMTRRPGVNKIPKGNLRTSFGSFGTHRDKGELWGTAGPLHYYGFGSYANSGGFRPSSDELERRSFLKLEAPVGDTLRLNGSFGYDASRVSEFELWDVGSSTKRKIFTRLGSAGFTFEPNEHVRTNALYKFSERRFGKGTYLLPSFSPFQIATSRSMVHEVSVNSAFTLRPDQVIVAGADIGVDGYEDLIVRLTTTRFDIEKSTTRQGYYLNYQQTWRSLDVTVGNRLDWTNSYGASYDPSMGAAFHLPFWQTILRAGVGRAFNPPSLTDRYVSVGTTLANPDLKAENAVTYHFGFETQPMTLLHLSASFFQSFLRNSIQTIRRSDGFFQAVNLNRERRSGFETEARTGAWHGFSASYGTTYTFAIDKDTDDPIQGRPRFTQDVKLNFEKKLRGFFFNAHLAGRFVDLMQYSGFTAPVDRTMIADGKIMIRFPKVGPGNFSMMLTCKNLFNGNFSFDQAHAPLPPRSYEVGAEFQF